MPGKPKDVKSAGCNALIKSQQAILLENVDDIVRELNWDIAIQTAKKQLQNLSAEEEK